jgi:putative hemolysin
LQASTLKNTSKFLETSTRYLCGDTGAEIHVRLARNQYEIIQAQQLRYKIFTEEFGAKIYSDQGRDVDEFDAHCQHLIAFCETQIVGTCRILMPEGAARAGRMYSETEFDLSSLIPIKHTLIELGRVCIIPEFRNGQVLRRLWNGLADILEMRPESYVMGCVSVQMNDGGFFAANLFQQLAHLQVKQTVLKATPLDPLPFTFKFPAEKPTCGVVVPPLLRTYIKLGAQLMGEPHWDLNFNVADFPMIANAATIEKRFGNRQFMT